MKRKFSFILGVMSLFFLSCETREQQQEAGFTHYVNPLVGTDFTGHTYPGAIVPFGMIQVSPDTKLEGWNGCSGYHYADSVIYGFSHTHLSGTGCGDYCDVMLMPFAGHASIKDEEYRSTFSHQNEFAAPGYYSVLLDKDQIEVQLTATKRVALQKYIFPDNVGQKGVILDLKHRKDIVLGSSIIYDTALQILSGTRHSREWNEDQRLSYVMQFSCPITKIEFFANDSLQNPAPNQEVSGISGTNCKALIYFAEDVKDVVVKVSISPDFEEKNALTSLLKNMEEVTDFDFEKVRTAATETWNSVLGKIVVETQDVEKKKVFYTAMYHVFTSPYLYTNADGTYLGRDGKMHVADEGHDIYTVFSLWDTYRALHPLLNLIDRKHSEDFLYTFLKQYEQGGRLPVWELSAGETDCMIGYHSIPVIYDAFVKGMTDYNTEKMLEAMIHSAKTGKRGLAEFEKYGYIPAEYESENISKTLEYAYDDWCIAMYAKALNHEDVYREFIERSQYYKNILDPRGFMHAKTNGSFIEPFDPAEVNTHLTEANSWQYSTYVPHDAANYIALLGGAKVAEQLFDSLFYTRTALSGRNQADITGLIGQYAHGNEPSHHAIYWYNFIGKPWKTAELARQIMSHFYTSKPDGLCGNEDCGQMSAWYVLCAMGFYSFCPGTNIYTLGSPIFDKISINLENGKTFTIICKNQSDKNMYIKSAQLNGQNYTKSYFTFDDFKNGGELVLDMSSKPNEAFGQKEDDRPRTGVESSITIVPYLSSSHFTFPGTMTLSMNLFQPERVSKDFHYPYPAQTDAIYYTLDGTTPTIASTRYTIPLTFTTETRVKAVSFNEKTGYSKVVEAHYQQYTKDKDILSQTPCNPMYNGGGDEALIDLLRGNNKYNLGHWKGYEGKDFDAILDLRAIKPVKEIGMGCLQDVGPWIVFPKEVVFEVSDDNVHYRLYGKVKAPVGVEDLTAQTFDFMVKKPEKARYVKVHATGFGLLPVWHAGAGGNSHLFIDEIFVR